MRFDEWWSIAVGLVYGFFAFALRRDGSVYLSLRGIRKSLLYEILKLEYPVLWTGMKSFPAEGRGDLCYV